MNRLKIDGLNFKQFIDYTQVRIHYSKNFAERIHKELRKLIDSFF